MDANEAKIKGLIKNPAIVKKMSDYVRLMGFEPHTNPEVLAGQCCIIREKNIEKFAEESRQYFATPNDFNRYVTSQEFSFDAPHGADELESKLGWYGFDDEETHHIAPLIMGAMAIGGKAIKAIKAAKAAKKAIAGGGEAPAKSGGLLSKLFKKKTPATTEQPVGSLVQRAGNKVKQLTKLKKRQQAQLDTAQQRAEYLNAQVSALQAGVPTNQVQGQSLATIQEAIKLENAPKEAGLISPNALPESKTGMYIGIGALLLMLFFIFKGNN